MVAFINNWFIILKGVFDMVNEELGERFGEGFRVD